MAQLCPPEHLGLVHTWAMWACPLSCSPSKSQFEGKTLLHSSLNSVYVKWPGSPWRSRCTVRVPKPVAPWSSFLPDLDSHFTQSFWTPYLPCILLPNCVLSLSNMPFLLLPQVLRKASLTLPLSSPAPLLICTFISLAAKWEWENYLRSGCPEKSSDGYLHALHLWKELCKVVAWGEARSPPGTLGSPGVWVALQRSLPPSGSGQLRTTSSGGSASESR
jgi:hypothetical protein